MNITAEEKIMYEVMKAIYNSGIPINFKGSMVLKASLIELGYIEEVRHTVDIDANWYSETSPTSEQMITSLQNVLDQNGIDLIVNIYRMYGEGRSAGFDLIDKNSGESLFTMDIDVNRPSVPTKIYEIADFHFRGVTPSQMIADKLFVISTDKIFRRIKDLIDLYYMSNEICFNKDDIMNILINNKRILGDFNGFL